MQKTPITRQDHCLYLMVILFSLPWFPLNSWNALWWRIINCLCWFPQLGESPVWMFKIRKNWYSDYRFKKVEGMMPNTASERLVTDIWKSSGTMLLMFFIHQTMARSGILCVTLNWNPPHFYRSALPPSHLRRKRLLRISQKEKSRRKVHSFLAGRVV